MGLDLSSDLSSDLPFYLAAGSAGLQLLMLLFRYIVEYSMCAAPRPPSLHIAQVLSPMPSPTRHGPWLAWWYSLAWGGKCSFACK